MNVIFDVKKEIYREGQLVFSPDTKYTGLLLDETITCYLIGLEDLDIWVNKDKVNLRKLDLELRRTLEVVRQLGQGKTIKINGIVYVMDTDFEIGVLMSNGVISTITLGQLNKLLNQYEIQLI